MLTYIIKTPEEKIQSSGHINDKEFQTILTLNAWMVIELHADGDELDKIQKQALNIPFTMNRVRIWFGDHAKFIAANVKFA